MNIQMERRILKAEEAAAARQQAKHLVKIMSCPDDGDADAVTCYRAEVEQAIRDGFFVINLVSLQPVAQA
jgi:hypothetical protein